MALCVLDKDCEIPSIDTLWDAMPAPRIKSKRLQNALVISQVFYLVILYVAIQFSITFRRVMQGRLWLVEGLYSENQVHPRCVARVTHIAS